MACFHPLTAYRTAAGGVVFSERARHDITAQMSLPCGQCFGCRLERSRQWALRCVHESRMHEHNSFVTLTYNNEHLPKRGMLQYSDFQLFFKRLRKAAEPNLIRFYMVGEYGELNWRPHYHACIFGLDFLDKKFWRVSDSGERCYRSDALEKLWGLGNCEVGTVTANSAAYCARYCITKINGDDILATARYGRVDEDGFYMLPREFNKMSLKPGIGAGWLEKFKSDVYPRDYVVMNGKETKPPKYYDILYGRSNPDEADAMKALRELDAYGRRWDYLPDRLEVHEKVARARAGKLHRSL